MSIVLRNIKNKKLTPNELDNNLETLYNTNNSYKTLLDDTYIGSDTYTYNIKDRTNNWADFENGFYYTKLSYINNGLSTDISVESNNTYSANLHIIYNDVNINEIASKYVKTSLYSLNKYYSNNGNFDTGSGFTYNSNNYQNLEINNVKAQSDGKILISGNFTSYKGSNRYKLIRINSDGTEDYIFSNNVNLVENDIVNTIEVLSNGEILIGGFFGSHTIKKLNSDGTYNNTFNSNIPSFNEKILCINEDSNGKLLLGGSFLSPTNRIIRLNSNGTLDTTFNTNIGTGFNGTVKTIVTLDDGKILIGGNFTSFNGNTRNYIVALNTNGTEYTTFYTSLFSTPLNNTVNKIKILSNGKVVIVGSFDDYIKNAFILNSDLTFDTIYNNTIYNILIVS